jgi:hypothetical protein
MKIKISKGYADTKHVEVLEPLTLDDFIIEEMGAWHSDYQKAAITGLKLILKDEVVDAIKPILPVLYYSDKDCQTDWTKSYSSEIKFNGCRTQEARDKKIEQVTLEAAGKMALRKEDRIYKLFSTILHDLEHRIEKMNEEYHEEMIKVFSGANLDKAFMEKELDDPTIVDEVKDLDEQIKELQEQRDNLDEKLRLKRNENMLDYLNANGWNDDEDGDKVYVTQEIRDEVTTMYKNGEAFGSKKRNRHPFSL